MWVFNSEIFVLQPLTLADELSRWVITWAFLGLHLCTRFFDGWS